MSPFNSPALAASVDVLATPDLIGIAMASRPKPPLNPLWLPSQRACTAQTSPDELPVVSPTPTTEQVSKDGFLDELIGCEKPLSNTPEGCKSLKRRAEPAVPDMESSLKQMQRTGSMLQMSHDLLKLANQGGSGGLQRRPSLTCMDLLSGR